MYDKTFFATLVIIIIILRGMGGGYSSSTRVPPPPLRPPLIIIIIAHHQVHYHRLHSQMYARSIRKLVDSGRETEPIGPTLIRGIEELWNDPGIQLAYTRRNEFQLADCAK